MEQDDKLQISFIGLEEKCKAFEAKYWEQVVKTDETASNHAHLPCDYKWRMQFLLSKSTIAEMKTTSH